MTRSTPGVCVCVCACVCVCVCVCVCACARLCLSMRVVGFCLQWSLNPADPTVSLSARALSLSLSLSQCVCVCVCVCGALLNSVIELHTVGPTGGLPAAKHYDSGSCVTIDFMLAEPEAGGSFETLELLGGKEVRVGHEFRRGDAIVFPSHKCRPR